MSDKALVLGATDIYPKLGSTLQSCCKDMVRLKDWYGHTFDMAGANFYAFLNARYTKARFFERIRACAAACKVVGIGMSDHGTTIPINGVNHAAIVFADSDWNDLDTFGLDTDFAAIYNDYPNTHFYVTADACESGELAFRLLGLRENNKFLEPRGGLEMEVAHNYSNGAVLRGLAPQLPNVAYLSGTGGKGFYSIDEGDGGAFTKHLTKLGKMTARQYALELDRVMDKAQQPQAHGGLADVVWFTGGNTAVPVAGSTAP